MKTKQIAYLCWVLLYPTTISAQSDHAAFHTIKEGRIGMRRTKPIADTLLSDSTIDSISDIPSLKAEDFSILSIGQLEELIGRYEHYLANRSKSSATTKTHNQQVHSYYNGTSHELTLSNLVDVIEEVGLSNQLFVLAQAVLETGNFTSNVCKNYHNLFGLYDSRNNDYYRFARWEDSVIGYQKYIQYRYKGGNYLQFLRRIGYAEDPRYTSKVAEIATQLYKRMFNQ